jgi:hypothetical protein
VTLSVLGLGLASPAGASARDHVFFPRAEAPLPLPSPFRGADGRRIDVRYCPWIEPFEEARPRLLALARSAIIEASAACPAHLTQSLPLYLVAPAPRPGLPEDAIGWLGRALVGDVSRRPVVTLAGAASVFAALAQIAEGAARGGPPGAILVGVDSLVARDALTHHRKRAESPFLLAPLPPGEGAGALLVASPALEASLGLPSLGVILASHVALGRGADEDDEPADAAAMTSILRALSGRGPIQSVFGQGRVDALRAREWEWSAARASASFSPRCLAACIEEATGALGAAAGVMSLAFAFAMFRHGALPPETEAPAPFLAWTISRDGLRGAALGVARLAQVRNGAGAAVLVPLAERAVARRVEHAPLPAEAITPEGRAFDGEADDEANHAAGLDEDLDAPEAAIDSALQEAFAAAAANDVEPQLPELPLEPEEAPPVALDAAGDLGATRAARITIAAFHDAVVASCLELASALGRDRFESPARRLPAVEARLLCQLDAIVAAGPSALAAVAERWRLAASDPWRAFAGALAAAAFAGDDALALIAREAYTLSPEAEDHAFTIAEALALSDHPGLPALARALFASKKPAAHAVGVRLRAARGELPEEALAAALASDEVIVARAAIEATERLPPAARARITPRLRALTAGALAWPAARALVVLGDREVLAEAFASALGARLGPRVADLAAIAPTPVAFATIETALGRARVTRSTLSAVARLGRVEAAPFLLERLEDPALEGAAAAGLVTLFGPIVSPEAARLPGAWREGIMARALEPGLRYRRGQPWSPAVVADECASGDLPRLEIERRLDELRVSLGAPDFIDVSGWCATAARNLAPLLAMARARARGGGRDGDPA